MKDETYVSKSWASMLDGEKRVAGRSKHRRIGACALMALWH